MSEFQTAVEAVMYAQCIVAVLGGIVSIVIVIGASMDNEGQISGVAALASLLFIFMFIGGAMTIYEINNQVKAQAINLPAEATGSGSGSGSAR